MYVLRIIVFVLGIVVCAIGLIILPFNEIILVTSRLENICTSELDWRDKVVRECGSFTSVGASDAERPFILRALRASPLQGQLPCDVQIHYSRAVSLGVKTQWAIGLKVGSDKLLFERSLSLETPRPLCLLPIVVLIFSLLFDFRFWGLALATGAHIFFLGGLNLIRSIDLALKSAFKTIVGDASLVGLSLIVLWLALSRSSWQTHRLRSEQGPRQGFLNIALGGLIGFWNPLVFTLLGRHLYPFRKKVQSLSSFLDYQFIWAAISLYGLVFQSFSMRNHPEAALLMPRYFSFAGFFWVLVRIFREKPNSQALLWRTLSPLPALCSVAVMEGLRLLVPWLGQFNFLTRIGVALVVSELIIPKKRNWKEFIRMSTRLFGGLLFSLFIATTAQLSGLTDLALFLWNPTLHPSALSLFTFLSGLAMGGLIGSFPTAFFPLLVFMRFPDAALVRAALVDGVLAGILLSPFSLLNLIPFIQFRATLRTLLRIRLAQISIPLTIALLSYAVGAISQVGILQPASFIFCCLVALAVKIKENPYFGQLSPKIRMG